MTERELERVKRKMNEEGWSTLNLDVKFDKLHCISHGKEKFAVAVWNKKEEVAADEKKSFHLKMLGDPHCTGSYQYRYDTPFTKTECVVCIAPLGEDGQLSGDFKWLHGKSHSAYDYEGGSKEIEKHHKDGHAEFSFRGAGHSLEVADYVDMTDMDAVGAWVLREAKGMPNSKRVDVVRCYSSPKAAEDEAQRQVAVRENLQVYAGVCGRLMSADERKRWKRIDNFSKLRKAVAEKRVTLAQKISVKMAKMAKQMSVGRGK